VNAVPAITRSGGAASQSVNWYTAITTITYTASNATSISRSGSTFPSGLNGATSGLVHTISGTPTAAGTFGYTITASHTNGCASATATGTLTVVLGPPPGAASTQTWVVGAQTWSAPLIKAQTGCTVATDLGTTNPPTVAYYRTQGLVSGSGYLYNWKCVNDYATQLCPSPWRVPTSDDFIALDKALGGTGNKRSTTAAWINTNYVTKWGNVFGGIADGSATKYQNQNGDYWSNTANSNTIGLHLAVDTSPLYVIPAQANDKRWGMQVRCVR
jgi:uncharacterized protein (TIGR02145 family)